MPLETHDQYFYFPTEHCGYSRYVTSSLTRGRVRRFTIAAGPLQRSHSQVKVPRDPWPHFTVSNSRLPQRGGWGPRRPLIYNPQEQGGSVIPPDSELNSSARRLISLTEVISHPKLYSLWVSDRGIWMFHLQKLGPLKCVPKLQKKRGNVLENYSTDFD
jgi:hypothetical protein